MTKEDIDNAAESLIKAGQLSVGKASEIVERSVEEFRL